jgi:inosose dehydratase
MNESRRRFIVGLGSLAAASALPSRIACAAPPLLYPPIDLSYFDRPVTPARAEIRFGYAAITWDGNDEQAIKDISEVGFRGIQLRANLLNEFGNNPKTVADLLRQHKLQFVALSGGGPRGYDYDQAQEIETQIKQAAFLKSAGGLYLQMTDSARPKDRKPSAADFKKLGRLLTEVGKRTTDLGVKMAYHNHMNTLGQAPEELDALMDAADARYVKLLLDVAHYAQGGGDPVKAIRRYHDRLLFLHIKDVESTGEGGSGSYRFVELGRGRVDLPAVFAALNEIKFRGWAIVELDSVPEKSRTAKECAIISKTYLEKLGMRV